MGLRSVGELWKKAESTRSLGYNSQSLRTKGRQGKAVRDKEVKDMKLRKGYVRDVRGWTNSLTARQEKCGVHVGIPPPKDDTCFG